jgi:hypothetical protein
LAQLREQVATLVNGRDELIRRALEQAPDRVSSDKGFIGRLRALRSLAEDPEIAAVIILIDVVSFGLELSAVLAKITAFVPTTYSKLLARNAFLTAVQLADDIERTINADHTRGEEQTQPPQFAPPSPETPQGESFEEPQGSETASPFAAPPVEPHNDDTPPTTPRRGRGRPRKTLALN